MAILAVHVTDDFMLRLEAAAFREQTSVETLVCLALLDRVDLSEAKSLPVETDAPRSVPIIERIDPIRRSENRFKFHLRTSTVRVT